jgi:hypothetical protein
MTAPAPGRGSEDLPEPPRLRALRRLVTALTATLILGMITVVVLLVVRLSALQPAPPPALPDALALPPGETAQAVTLCAGWVAVVTLDAAGAERIRVFDATTGAERAAVAITAASD